MPNWKKLRHARGVATKVPTLIAALADPDVGVRANAFFTLRDAAVGDGAWFSASPGIVEALLAALSDDLPDGDRVLVLLADVVAGGHVRAWLRSDIEAGAADCVAALVAQRGRVRAELAGPRRAAAALLVSLVDALELKDELEALADTDEDPLVRASALIGLSRSSDAASRLPVAVRSDDDSLRGAVAIARLRADAKCGYTDVANELAAWLRAAKIGEPIPWFRSLRPHRWYRGLEGPDNVGHGLVALARHRGDEDALVSQVFALAAGEHGSDEARALVELQATKIALSLGDFAPTGATGPPPIDVFDALSDAQKAMARRLADSWLLAAGSFGLPAAGGTRRRWAGLDPPASLETLVTLDGVTTPAWKAMAAYGPDAFVSLEPLERYQAWVELTAVSYPPKAPALPPARIETLLAELAIEPEALADRATTIAEELAERFAAASRQRVRSTATFPMSALLFLPIVRVGRVVEPKWEALLYLGPEPQSREVFATFPEARRAALLVRRLQQARRPRPALKAVFALADLGRSEELAALVDTTLSSLEGKMAPRQLTKLLEQRAAWGE